MSHGGTDLGCTGGGVGSGGRPQTPAQSQWKLPLDFHFLGLPGLSLQLVYFHGRRWSRVRPVL